MSAFTKVGQLSTFFFTWIMKLGISGTHGSSHLLITNYLPPYSKGLFPTWMAIENSSPKPRVIYPLFHIHKIHTLTTFSSKQSSPRWIVINKYFPNPVLLQFLIKAIDSSKTRSSKRLWFTHLSQLLRQRPLGWSFLIPHQNFLKLLSISSAFDLGIR